MTVEGRASARSGRSTAAEPGYLAGVSTSPDVARKVRQLDHDVQEIYAMLAGIAGSQQRQGNRLEELAVTQAEHTTLGEHTAKLDEHGAKLHCIIELPKRP